MGRSRSASLVIMYIMYKFKIGADEAFEYVLSRRNVIDPNKGFREALYKYEEMMKNGYKVKSHKKAHDPKPIHLKTPGEEVEISRPKKTTSKCLS